MKKYIRYENNRYLTTTDNWITIQLDEIINQHIPENSLNKIFEVKFRYQYGENQASIILSEFKKIMSALVTKGIYNDNDGYGMIFEIFSISVIYNRSYDSVIQNNIVFGSNDGKIDAIIFYRNECHIYQIKMGDIQEGEIDIAKSNIDEFILNNSISSSNSRDLLYFCQKNEYNIKHNIKKFFTISKNRNFENNIKVTEIYKRFFNIKLINQSENNLFLKFEVKNRVESQRSKNESNYANIENEVFMFIPALEIVEQIEKFAKIDDTSFDKLFYDNVRGYKGVNENMQKTLTDRPKSFCLYNNGISIIGDTTINNPYIEIVNPIIINGQQTVTNLYDAFKKGKDLSLVMVPVFLKDNIEDEKMNIAKYNNSQSPIKTVDLLSLNKNLRELQNSLLKMALEQKFDEYSYYLNLYSSGKKQNNEYIKILFKPENIIKISDFLRVYSVMQDNSKMGNWKNSVTKMIEISFIRNDNAIYPNFEDTLKICRSISEHNRLIKKSKDFKAKYSSANIVLEYLFIKNDFNIQKCLDIVEKYERDYFYNKDVSTRLQNKADLYKTNSVSKEIEKIISDFESVST